MATTIVGRHPDDRSNAGAEAANHQQGGLGKSVSRKKESIIDESNVETSIRDREREYETRYFSRRFQSYLLMEFIERLRTSSPIVACFES